MLLRLSMCMLLFAAGASIAVHAQTRVSPCSDAMHRQFDFWLGNWRVVDANAKFQGTNNVTSEFGGCVLQEHWKGAGGSAGSSFNSYMPGSKRWQQTWVDNRGLTLHLLGGIMKHDMVLEGDRATAPDKTVTDRITWTPLSDGRVRQHWQESKDHGTHWQDVFDGYYAKAQ